MGISKRLKARMAESSWIRRMFETGLQLKAQYGAERVCDLSLGNPDLEPPELFRERLREAVATRAAASHGYMPNAGYRWVREQVAAAVAREQGVAVGPDELIMTCGAGGALNVALKTLLEPGDVVLVSSPCFMEYRFYVDNHGGSLDLVPARPDFDLDVEAIARRIGANTAAVLLNSPHNPTGRVYPESTLRALGEALTERSRRIGRTIYLVSDEPYRKIVFDGLKVPSVMAAYRNTIVASSYSKELSIAGERIGWLAVHPQAEAAGELVDGFVFANRILGYVNAPALMQRVVAGLGGVAVDSSVYQRRRDMLCEALERIGYRFRKPEGTFYLFPEAPGGDDLAAVEELAQERILTVPGRGFGAPGYFRIAFCVEDSVIERSLEGFERAYQRLASRARR